MVSPQKTPISVLMEMMVKQCSIPTWELIHDGGGTHENMFIYQVMCDGKATTGEGRNKREAKHQAATNMLELLGQQSELLQLPASPHPSPDRMPLLEEPPSCPKSLANVPFRNAVGDLKDLCDSNNLEEPKYRESSAVGLPHAKIFTIECSVLTFTEEGTSTTKKQAKHEAAKKMIDRIEENLESIIKSQPTINNFSEEDMEIVGIEAAELYPGLSMSHSGAKLKVNLGIKIKDYHRNFKDYFITEESLNEFSRSIENLFIVIKNCKAKFSHEILKEVKDQFQDLLKSINVQCYESQLENKDEDLISCCLRVNTAPDIVEIAMGKSKEEAYLNVLQATLETMQLFLN